jgi:DNA-binding NtrC family response regulator
MPIIIISAFVGPKEIGKLLDLGATFFLPKPIDFKDLKEGITKCLKKSERQKMNKIYSYYYQTNQ